MSTIDTSTKHRFKSRAGLLLSALGIAVGTGNIWRFPRIAAQNGSENGAGALIIAWVIFLFIWSIPLIIAEYTLGRKFRHGLIGTFVLSIGKQFAWAGAFVGFVAAGISFFYAIIVGWAAFHFIFFINHPLPLNNYEAYSIWNNFQVSGMPSLFHTIVVLLGLMAIWKGIRSIETINKILIPFLIVIIIICLIETINLEGAGNGIKYLFSIDFNQFLKPNIWLQALTQNAWDTGAGWGLFLTYAAYMKIQHGTVKNAYITGIGNNVISLLMAIVIFGTVFSVSQNNLHLTKTEVLEIMKTSGPASTGLTFIWIPQLFSNMVMGRFLAIIFFMGLTFAGFSSLIAMYEMSTRIFIDYGIKRINSILIVGIVSFLIGIPSVLSIDFLSNQDFVWGLGLIISGVLIAFCIRKFGASNVSYELIKNKFDWKIGRFWNLSIKYFIPFLGVVLIAWWLFLSISIFAKEGWFNPFSPFSVSTCFFQWGLILFFLIFFNNRIGRFK